MAVVITRGQTFGQLEQITNTKLHNLVDLATITGVELLGYSSGLTNASIPNISAGSVFKLNASTYCSIASFTGMQTGQMFTLIAGQASYPCILDAGSFLLSADWIAAKSGDNLTLVWDGTSFIEIARVAV